MGKDSKHLPIVSRDNYEDWFRRAKIKIKSKGAYYTIETSRTEYAWIQREGGTKSSASSSTLTSSEVDNITSQFERLGGTWNLEKAKEWDLADAKALEIILEGLDEDDAVLIDEYETAAAVWTQLKLKYEKTSTSTANQYMTSLQNFVFDKDVGIDGSWTKLKEYRRKLIAANGAMRNAYPDDALFLILTLALGESQYTAVIDGFLTQSSLSTEEKVKILQEKEARIQDTKTSSGSKERANAAWRQHNAVYRHPNHHSRRASNSSDVDMTDVAFECFCCGSTEHFIADCEFREAVKEFARNLRLKKERQTRKLAKDSRIRASRPAKAKTTTSRPLRSSDKKPHSRQKKHGHAAIHDSESDATSDYSSTDSESKDPQDSDDDETTKPKTEKVMLSKESIRKSTPHIWALDTGASSPMTDQLHLFRDLRPISKVSIQVGGGMLYSRLRGTALVSATDGTSCYLDNVLYVPKLGVNLVSAKKLCKGGYRGAFDEETIWITRENKTVMTAEQSQGLYIVKHVAKKYKGKVLGQKPAVAMRAAEESDNQAVPAIEESDVTDDESSDEATKDRELERYLKYHQRFAHLGPDKIRNLHKVTTLQRRIKIPRDRDICDVCAITKLKNRIPKKLSAWPKTILDLIQFDVAGPLPTTIRGNRWFLLIIDICSRREWVLPLKHKGDAYQALKDWKAGVERQAEKKVRRARSDNAPELLKAIDDWRIEDGVLAQSTTIASSHQNGPAERSIQTVEADMRAMLEEAQLPIEFWDEAAEADSYMRNHTATGPVIDGQKTCPLKAFTGETPSIDHIRKWGSKCFYYVDKKTIPANERHDKLVNPGRVGVFMGYSENTNRHLKVYSPERGYTIISSRVVIKESVKGGTVDLRIRNCAAGPQGTPNLAFDRRPRGRPKGLKDVEPLPLSTDLLTTISVPRIEIPVFTPPANIPAFTEEDMPDYKDLSRQSQEADQGEEAPIDHGQEASTEKLMEDVVEERANEATSQDASQTVDPVDRQPQAKPFQATVQEKTTEAAHEDPKPSTTEQPRYFTRAARKRATSDVAEDQTNIKRARAMVAQLLSRSDDTNLDLDELKDPLRDDFETAFPAEVIAGIQIPRTYKEATQGQYAEQWRAAMAEEMLSLHANGTFQEVVPPKGANLVSCKWVFTIKTTTDGALDRYKARLVARGFSQVYGQDYDQTFAPTVRMDTLRLFLAAVAAEDLECSQYDIKNAFTESHLKEEIYLEPPKGITVKKGRVWKALRSLYGLKQAARDWNRLIKKELLRWGFVQSLADPCMFVHSENSIRLLVYVDDIVAAAKKQGELDWFYAKLSDRFSAKNLGEINKILGARITRDRKNRTLEIDQEQYLKSVLDKFGITHETHKPKAVPSVGYENLRPASDNDERINVTEYQQAIGSVMYAMIFTRPDIAFILGKLSQFMSDPAKHHGHVLKSLLRYLKSTIKTRIRYGPGGAYKHFVLYSDADWAGDKTDRKSISGSVTMFYGGPISWSSKKQRSVATSSCESEYMALANCAKQGQWIAQIFRDLGLPKYIGKNPRRVQMLGDNQGAIALTENAHLNERSKHVDICYHFIRDLAERGALTVDYIPTADMVADGMTKPLARVAFERFKSQIGLSMGRRGS
jgi:hypothetical protein